ncbi:PEGA domain-containing protein [Methanocalculus sp.]|uniref:PEGA domain-containing protein n=1 Tax=Methanocalculus sp. TaxID=2004547 RepID=UPI002622B752|nr:PEGA domain-containing protein [Methanocalculus sp.]MDG6249216.1 PEGA domain-containing protein [Methanocalculus sp.]
MLMIRSIILAAFVVMLCAAIPASAQIGGDVGIISVTSDPSGADVNLDGHYEGTTPVEIKIYTTGTPPGSIIVSKSGYKAKTVSAPQPSAGQTEYVHVTLEPIAPTPTPVYDGYFSIDSSPRGATVRVDGRYIGTTPVTAQVTAGTTHRVQVEYPGYDAWSAVYTAYSGQTTNIYASLSPTPQTTGYLSITSSPSGADVYVDGSYRGYAPMTVGNLVVGAHTLELRLSGYQKSTQTVQIYSGQTTTKNVVLSPSTPSTGSVSVQSYPSGASIYLDGNYQGNTYPNDYFDIIGVSTGTHSLMLRKPGYYDYTTTISVTGGGIKYVSGTLTPQTAPATTGKANVMSGPSGAEVYVDNLFRGYSPVLVPDLAAGTHSITLKMSGYSDWMSSFEVTAGQTTPVSATLTPQPVPPAPTPSGSLPFAVIGAVGLLGVLLFVAKRR